MNDTLHVVCHECDLLIKLTKLQEGNKASCPRCNYTLTVSRFNTIDRVLAFSVTAVFFLCLSFVFPFLSFSLQGLHRTVSLSQSIGVLISEDFTSLAVIVFVFTIAIPVLYLLNVIYVFLSLTQRKLFPYTALSLKWVSYLKHWNMSEIFLIGILVSFIKIASLADITLELSFITYVLFIISMTFAILHIDNHQVWKWLKEKDKLHLPYIAIREGVKYQGCHVCNEVSEIGVHLCDKCGSKLHARINNSIQKTWALLITSICLYIPANLLPIMHTTLLGDETESTILGGVLVLWEHGSYPIALIIFIASIIVPMGKIIALCLLCLSVQRKSKNAYKQKTQLYRVTELIGRWSMIDVFVVVILVALIHLGNLMSIYPGWGAVAFAGMVVMTILAAISFDPRLIWDPLNETNEE